MKTPPDHAPNLSFTDSGFFLLRSPLLPVEEFTAWSDGLKTPILVETKADLASIEQAWRDDVQLLRSRLRQLIDRPEIVHAIFIASPSLESGLEHWRRDPDSKKGLQAERAFVRYLIRMVCRPTPFGLFSACSLGSVATDESGEGTAFRLRSRQQYVPSTRLDFDYLFAVTRTLRANPAVAQELRYWPNSTLYCLGDAWHYIESRVRGNDRSYHVVRLDDDGYLSAVLARAQEGATLEELREHIELLPDGTEFSLEEITSFLKELVDSEVLVPSLSPLLTGEQALDDIIAQLLSLPSGAEFGSTLASVRDQLAEIDELGLGVDSGQFRKIAEQLKSLAQPDLARLFQTDLVKPFEVGRISRPLADEIMKGIELLRRVGRSSEPEELRQFRDAFSLRYEQAWVPLLEALDPDVGIGFGRNSGADGAPLLRGLNFGANSDAGSAGGVDFGGFLLQKIAEGGAGRTNELVLDPSEIPPLDPRSLGVPDSFGVGLAIAANSAEAIDRGDFSIFFIGSDGPPGVRMWGRFCHIDEEIHRQTVKHLSEEESFDKDSVYAEIAYLPEGRIGNVLCRPRLRKFEIPYLARSGAPREHQIPVSDLLVSVLDNKIRLFSTSLNRYVVPRLTNAHGYLNPNLAPVYRFLCYLQHQGGRGVPAFNWGQLEGLSYLPRVRVGRFVLSRARWKLTTEEINRLKSGDRLGRYLAMQALREKRRFPRWIALQEMDYSLPVDLDNPLSVDALAHALGRVSDAVVHEVYPSPSELCVEGPEGRFFHELHVPFLRRPAVTDSESSSHLNDRKKDQPALMIPRGERIFPPGSEWLYVKLYGGEAFLDHLLPTTIPEIVGEGLAEGAIDRWFFLRYADPHPHLRIRFHGEPHQLTKSLLPRLAKLNNLVVPGKLWKVQFDTYEREVERYGGPEGMGLSEQVFFADSESALAILQEFQSDEGLGDLWKVAVLGADRFLSDFGLDLESKRDLLRKLRDSYEREFKVGSSFRKQLGDRFRAERKSLERIFKGLEGNDNVSEDLRTALVRRSERIKSTVAALQTASNAGLLLTDFESLVSSYLHMNVNRLFRSSQRAHELVLYDFLFRIYDGEHSRNNGKEPATDAGRLGEP